MHVTTQKMKFAINISLVDWSHLVKKSLMGNFIFFAVSVYFVIDTSLKFARVYVVWLHCY